jgi:hypothetical protein
LLLVGRLSDLYPVLALSISEANTEDLMSEDPDGLELCYYYMQTIYNVIHNISDILWSTVNLSSKKPGKNFEYHKVTTNMHSGKRKYTDFS